MVKYLQGEPASVIRIYGHTDSRGTEAYNQDLSERRAKAVYRYFIAHGINRKRIEYKGYGELKPIREDDSREWAAMENRRVEIIVWKK